MFTFTTSSFFRGKAAFAQVRMWASIAVLSKERNATHQVNFVCATCILSYYNYNISKMSWSYYCTLISCLCRQWFRIFVFGQTKYIMPKLIPFRQCVLFPVNKYVKFYIVLFIQCYLHLNIRGNTFSLGHQLGTFSY